MTEEGAEPAGVTGAGSDVMPPRPPGKVSGEDLTFFSSALGIMSSPGASCPRGSDSSLTPSRKEALDLADAVPVVVGVAFMRLLAVLVMVMFVEAALEECDRFRCSLAADELDVDEW